jgi:uncharacterized membrane protein YdjX (TVP38/TMEM64 family)
LKKINPIWLLIGFNVLLFVFRDWILPAGATARFGDSMEALLASLGAVGYLGIVGIYSVCSFFFIPLLIPLNILCGAIYGPYAGTAVSIVGITLGCYASTLSVRHVFTGMQRAIDRRPSAQKILAQFARHGAIVVIVVRLAFIVPYMIQNIVLAATTINIYRLVWLTAIGSLPGAAIYSFLGAGLVQSESANEFAIYLAVPLLLLGVISLLLRHFNKRYGTS